MQAPRNFTVAIDEVELSVNEWAGDSDPILLLHATGFHSRCWDQVVKGLPGQHVYAVDIHLHGGSSAVNAEVDWGLFSADIVALIEQLDLRNIVGVGHSMGGHLITRICAALPDRFKQLVLIDPVIFPPEFYTDSAPALEESRVEDHPVSRRKNNWLDAQEMFLRFKDRPPFDSWQEEVLQDYCDYALLPADEEGFRQLACNPINEASIYLIHVGNEVILAMLPHIATPVTLLRAPPDENFVGDFSKSPTWPELANYLPCCREFYLPDHTHFIPMEDPELVAGYIREAQRNQWQA
jgi:pimeloyl-ACP methyl ester carboxylesterase